MAELKYTYEDSQDTGQMYDDPNKLNSIIKHYGNSYFKLSTLYGGITDEGDIIFCDGVLREMPEMGISTSWESGPASTFASKVTEFIKNDALEAIQYLSPTKDKTDHKIDHFVFSDEWTAKVYEDAEMNSITLSFRCYTKEQIGFLPTANASQWLRFLTAYAAVAVSRKPTDVSAFKNKIANTIDDTADTVSTVKEIKHDPHVNNIKSFLNEVDNRFLGTFDSRRVTSKANASDSFGAKLFLLHIYPFLFVKPFPVYISNWKMTPSKETIQITVDNKTTIEHVYYDFEITCEMDQLYTSKKFVEFMYS